MKQQVLKQLFSLLLGLLPLIAFSQKSADSLKQKHSESVTIYGTSSPIIRQAYKINSQPQLPEIKINTAEPLPHFQGEVFPTTITLEPIKPALINTERKQKTWQNYFSAGLGSRISPYAEFFHSGGEKNSYLFNAHFKHLSSFKNIKDYLPSPYSHTLAELSFDKYFRYHILSLSASYDYKTNRYYGYNTKGDTTAYNKNDSLLKQSYQKVSLALDFSSLYKNFDKLHHHVSLGGTYYLDRYGTSEWQANMDFDLHKAFQVTDILDHQQLGITGGYKFYKNQTKYLSQIDHFATVMPYFDAHYGILSFDAGLNFEWLKQAKAKLHFYPHLTLNVNVLPQSLSFYGGWEGGLEKNSMVQLTGENPFLNSFQNNYQWQNTRWKFYAGLRGNIVRRLDFELSAARSSFENMAFFDYPYFFYLNEMPTFYVSTNDGYFSPYKNEFSIIYNNGKVWDFNGSLSWSNSTTLKLWLKGAYHQYQLDYDQKPYYKPLHSMSFGASYLINDKIMPWVEVFYEGRRWARASYLSYFIFPTAYELDSYVDVNLGLDYQINKQLSAFGRVTNLLNKRYYRFNEYPVAGLEIMLGISYKF